MKILSRHPASKMALAGLLAVAVASISACGGGADDGSGSHSVAKNIKSEPVRKLYESCPEVHDSTQISFLSCAAGTYKGTDVRTGAECTTILTETGQVSFINGATTIRTFDLVSDFIYHMDKTKGPWAFHLEGKNRHPILLWNRRLQLTMKVDSAHGRYLDIIQKNTDPVYGADLDATCRITF